MMVNERVQSYFEANHVDRKKRIIKVVCVRGVIFPLKVAKQESVEIPAKDKEDHKTSDSTSNEK